jgi:hypothetical protein
MKPNVIQDLCRVQQAVKGTAPNTCSVKQKKGLGLKIVCKKKIPAMFKQFP